jgi:hypothetical protein
VCYHGTRISSMGILKADLEEALSLSGQTEMAFRRCGCGVRRLVHFHSCLIEAETIDWLISSLLHLSLRMWFLIMLGILSLAIGFHVIGHLLTYILCILS